MHEREYLGWGPPVVVSNLLDPVYDRLELHGVVKETFSGYRLQSSKEGTRHNNLNNGWR
jgi:hypothetical protein